MNGGRVRPIRLGNIPIDEMLPARRTSIGNRIIHLQGDIPDDDRYAAMVSLKEYPPETGAGMLDHEAGQRLSGPQVDLPPPGARRRAPLV